MRKKRIIILAVSLALILLIACILIFTVRKAPTKSQALLDNVKSVSSSDKCSNAGINKLSVYGPSVANNTKYSIAAREAVLNYLSSCYFDNHNYSQAINYATSLEKLYEQTGNNSKAINQAVFIKYMKSLGGTKT